MQKARCLRRRAWRSDTIRMERTEGLEPSLRGLEGRRLNMSMPAEMQKPAGFRMAGRFISEDAVVYAAPLRQESGLSISSALRASMSTAINPSNNCHALGRRNTGSKTRAP